MRRTCLKILLLTCIASLAVSAAVIEKGHEPKKIIHIDFLKKIEAPNGDSIFIGVWGDPITDLSKNRYSPYNFSVFFWNNSAVYQSYYAFDCQSNEIYGGNTMPYDCWKTNFGIVFAKRDYNVYCVLEKDSSISYYEEIVHYDENFKATHTGRYEFSHTERKLSSTEQPKIEARQYQDYCRKIDTLTIGRFQSHNLGFFSFIMYRIYISKYNGCYYYQEFSAEEYVTPDKPLDVSTVSKGMRFDFKEPHINSLYMIYSSKDSNLVFYDLETNKPSDTAYWLNYDYFTSEIDSNIYLGNNAENHKK